jgi:dTDP-glucose 4,6-dehydratase
VRDWVHVADNCRALLAVLERGRPGETYHIGGGEPLANIDVLRLLLKILGKPESLLTSVTDRLGHDRRYAVDFSKTTEELGWRPEVPFEQGLRATVEWYRENSEWVRRCRSGEYRAYYAQMYGEREAGATSI